MGVDTLITGWRREILSVLGVALASLILMRVPMVGWIFYPFQLFVTFVHELSHGFAALLTGGSFRQFTISPDGSGLALTAGGWRWVISSAGYVGSAIFGGLLLVIASRRGTAPNVLFWMGIGMTLLCLLFARNLFGFGIGILMSGLLVAAGLRLPEPYAEWLLLFLAVQSTLGAVDSLFGLVQLSTFHRTVMTDAQNMANSTGVPAFIWALLWSGVSLVILWQALAFAYRDG